MFKELGFKKVAKISQRRKDLAVESSKIDKDIKTKLTPKQGPPLPPVKVKKSEGWIPGDQSRITTPIKKGISDAKAYVKPRLKKVKAFSKDYTSGNQGYIPGDQTKFKANVKKTYGKVKAFTKDYFAGNQGYLPGNQTKLKANVNSRLTKVTRGIQDWKAGRSGHIPGDQSQIRESITGFFSGKKKKKKKVNA